MGTAARMPAPAARPTPMPKRPKGRLFIGTFLFALLLSGSYTLWSSVFRFDAYGTVSGRVIEVSASHGGVVRSVHVREGDKVDQGQRLVTLHNLELEQRLGRLGDELLVAQANLDAELVKLQWQTQQQGDQSRRASADYFELWGELAQHQSRLAELQTRLDREQSLQEIGALSAEQLDETRFAVEGQTAKVAKLQEALAERKQLAELSQFEPTAVQLKPLTVKIETLQTEMARLRTLIQDGEIRAPVSGRVIRSHHFTGEQVASCGLVMEILEADSMEAIVYLPQSKVSRVSPVKTLPLQIAPNAGRVTGTVTRFGERYVPVPESLARFYHRNEHVLPVHIRLPNELHDQLQLGLQVRLPSQWPFGINHG